MAKTKTFLFDLDGVIVDTAKFHFLSWKEIAAEFDFEFSEKENEQLKGISRVNSLELILKWAGVELLDEKKASFLDRKNRIYLEKVKNLTTEDVLPGVLSTLEFLKERNIKTGIGSASKNAAHILNILNLTSSFDVIVGGNDVSKSKPDPEVFVKGAEALGTPYNQCLVIEDSRAGLMAAKSVEMKTIAIGRTEELSIADYQCSNLSEFSVVELDEIIEA